MSSSDEQGREAPVVASADPGESSRDQSVVDEDAALLVSVCCGFVARRY